MDDIQVIKLDENTIRVTKSVPVATDFTLDYLTAQRAAIVAQRDRDNAQRDIEIAEVDALLANCERLNIVSSVPEASPIELPIENIVDPLGDTVSA